MGFMLETAVHGAELENSNLEGLFLSENQIEGISADFLALVKLKSLWLKGNRIERAEDLKSCRLLVHLDLSRNRLTGPVSEETAAHLRVVVVSLQGLETLIGLESLNLSDNQITAIGNLSHLTRLEELNLGNNRLSTLEGQLPSNVTALRVSGNHVSDLQSLTRTLAKLNELYIQDNTTSNLEPIVSRFPELESLDVRNNRVRSAAQFSVLSACKALQDIWLIGNPCCLSTSYLVDVFAALPELKTLDNLTDVQLQNHIEGLKNGTISSHAGVSTPRPQTPSSCRPWTASSRPGSSGGVGSRPITPSGRPGTPDSPAPIFYQPSARIGNLVKLVTPAEIEKAKTDVDAHLQKMKDMLHKMTGTEPQLGQNSEPKVRQRVPSNEARGDFRSKSDRNSEPSRELPPTETRKSTSEEPKLGAMSTVNGSQQKSSKAVGTAQRVQTVRMQTRKACVDAGIDPIDSLMGNNLEWRAPPSDSRARGHEIETQTASLPPPPISLATPTEVDMKGFQYGEQQSSALSPEKGQKDPEPKFDGDLIEQEMKLLLLQYVNNNDGSGMYDSEENRNGHEPEAYQYSKYMESPRMDPIKIAEQRRPPNSRSRKGYRSFRMPLSRPNSSNAV
ncbi:Protein phosphatase 1, partial [Globisporangium splendens]